MEGFKPTKSPQNTRGENIGAAIVDAGPLLAEQLVRDGEEVFESAETGVSYVLNEKQRKRVAAKANKQDAMHARFKAALDIKLEADGTLKPTKISKPGQAPAKDNTINAMIESQQTVLTATARSHGLKVNTHAGAVKALKNEKVEIKQEKVVEKKEKRKHAKKEENKRERAKEHDGFGKVF